jgi:putative transcriptional regulator
MRDLIYSNNVYALRTELGISQDKMAADLEISRRTISKIENGEQNPSLEIVYRISAYFKRLVPEVFPINNKTHLRSHDEFEKFSPKL